MIESVGQRLRLGLGHSGDRDAALGKSHCWAAQHHAKYPQYHTTALLYHSILTHIAWFEYNPLMHLHIHTDRPTVLSFAHQAAA